MTAVWYATITNASSELLANVAVLRDMLHFRDNPSFCSGLFDTGEIDAAIRVFVLSDNFAFFYILMSFSFYVVPGKSQRRTSCMCLCNTDVFYAGVFPVTESVMICLITAVTAMTSQSHAWLNDDDEDEYTQC